jgi:nitric oxide reductase activation protein
VPSIPDDAPAPSGGRTPTAEELARLAASGVQTSTGGADDGGGAFVTSLLGKLIDARADSKSNGAATRTDVARTTNGAPDAAVFLYDEWDHVIADYRPAWCRLAELDVPDDAGVFFTSALARHATLVPEVRRQFQRVRPEAYRPVRGLEDGCDIDLVAAIDARADHRAGRPPSAKLYTARVRQERELATLFLLDMSASTDETVRAGDEDRHIIDVAKEALVVMAAALEEIGDAYAIYGFSGQGRHQVEFYRVKAFDERLVPRRGRLGGIRPKGSTRMGTAVRHAVHTMRRVRARARHLILLSDGFPQDLDYGEDRTSHVYGLRDTAVALREAEDAGIRPFCITVDLAGHDYLREMCDPDRYCVIERVADLASELPRVYERVVRAD